MSGSTSISTLGLPRPYARRARLAGAVCIAGAAVQILYGLLSIPFPYGAGTGYVWSEALWALATSGMIGGTLGLLWLDVGRPRWLAATGAWLNVLGQLIRIGVSIWILFGSPAPEAYIPFILISILLLTLGTAALGVSTVLGRQLPGWRAWALLLTLALMLVAVPFYSINLNLHFLLLGLWGLPWLLVGYVVVTHAALQERAAAAGA